MNRLLLLLFLLPMDLFSQGEHLLAIPVSKEVLKENKVSTVNVYENVDSSMKQTNTYFINIEGRAFEHIYYDPANEGAGPFDIERLRWSEDTLGLVHYTRGSYAETGDLNSLFADYQYFYSPTGKLKKMIYHDFLSYGTVRMMIYDTIHPNYEDKSECRMLNDDTIHLLRSIKNDTLYSHIIKQKNNGKWLESERGIYTYKNGEVTSYQLFKNGKLVNDFVPSKDKLINEEKIEEEFGLPVPEPFTKIIYSDKMDLINESNAKEKSAKFRLELHYENGSANEMDLYEVYDNLNGLLLIKSNPTGEYKTEFHYLFRK